MYTWVRSTTITLTDLLGEHFRSDPGLRPFFDPGSGGTMEVFSHTPQEMGDQNLTGLSVWLYRIARDEQLLNHPPPRIAYDRSERRPLQLRLHYLMSPIVSGEVNGVGPLLEQAIIGKVLQTFHDHPLLSGAVLRDDLVGTGIEIGVRLEPLGLEEITRVWDALEQSYQLCASYEVSVVPVHSDEEASRIAPVEIVQPEYGVITETDIAP